MDLKATLENKTSKSGNKYTCIVINLTDDYEKIVFLDKAELALLKDVINSNDTTKVLNEDNPFESFK